MANRQAKGKPETGRTKRKSASNQEITMIKFIIRKTAMTLALGFALGFAHQTFAGQNSQSQSTPVNPGSTNPGKVNNPNNPKRNPNNPSRNPAITMSNPNNPNRNPNNPNRRRVNN